MPRPPSCVVRRAAQQRGRAASAVLGQQPTELVEPVLEPAGGSRDAERRRPRRRRGPRTGAATPVEPDLELVDGDRVAAACGRARASRSSAARVGDACGGAAARAGRSGSSTARRRRRTPCRAPSSAAGRRPGSSRGCRAGSVESTWATCTTRSPRATPRLHGLAGVARRRAPASGGRAGPARRQRVVPGGVQPEQRAGDVAAGRRRARAGSVRSRAASRREVVDLASPVASLRGRRSVSGSSARTTVVDQRGGAVDRLGAASRGGARSSRRDLAR